MMKLCSFTTSWIKLEGNILSEVRRTNSRITYLSVVYRVQDKEMQGIKGEVGYQHYSSHYQGLRTGRKERGIWE